MGKISDFLNINTTNTEELPKTKRSTGFDVGERPNNKNYNFIHKTTTLWQNQLSKNTIFDVSIGDGDYYDYQTIEDYLLDSIPNQKVIVFLDTIDAPIELPNDTIWYFTKDITTNITNDVDYIIKLNNNTQIINSFNINVDSNNNYIYNNVIKIDGDNNSIENINIKLTNTNIKSVFSINGKNNNINGSIYGGYKGIFVYANDINSNTDNTFNVRIRTNYIPKEDEMEFPFIYGLYPEILDTTHFKVYPGKARDKSNVYDIRVNTDMTKTISSFSIGNNGGSVVNGVILQPTTWYYLFVVADSTSGQFDYVLDSDSEGSRVDSEILNNPLYPFDVKRRIGVMYINSSGDLPLGIVKPYSSGQNVVYPFTHNLTDMAASFGNDIQNITSPVIHRLRFLPEDILINVNLNLRIQTMENNIELFISTPVVENTLKSYPDGYMLDGNEGDLKLSIVLNFIRNPDWEVLHINYYTCSNKVLIYPQTYGTADTIYLKYDVVYFVDLRGD